jgi:hypothetical protein
MTSTPWHFLVVAIPGWMNRQQQQVIDCLANEYCQLGRDCIILNDARK